MQDEGRWVYVSPWMIESTELPSVRVGEPLDLAFEALPLRKPLPFPSDALTELRVIDVSNEDSHCYLVDTPDAMLGPMILVHRGGSLAVGDELNGAWMLTPEVDVSNPLWTPQAVKSWLPALVRTRLPVQVQETDLQAAELRYDEVSSTRSAGSDIGYRVRFRTLETD